MEKMLSTYNIGYTPTINQKNRIKQSNYISNKQLNNAKSDIFFTSMNKTFIMSKAKNLKDIPQDANIFIFSCKSKLTLPEGRNAKECILTEKDFGFWKKFFGGNEANTVNLKRNNIGYVHGESTKNGTVCGNLNVNSCKINQIENISNVDIKNRSTVHFINQVDELTVSNSKASNATGVKRMVMEENSKSDKIEAYNVSLTPGCKAKKIETENLLCKSDPNMPNKYSEVGEADVKNGAEICQARIKTLKTKDLIIKDSVVDNLTADGCLEFENSIIKNFEIYDIPKMNDCKAENILLKGYDPAICLHGKTQIENFNIKGSNAKFFVFPKKEWDKPVDNYIKKVNVLSEYTDNETPKIKFQGDINIDTVIFEKKPGLVEMTIPENPHKRINVINGYIKYNCPVEEIPKPEELP